MKKKIPIKRIRLVAEAMARYETPIDKVEAMDDLVRMFRPLFEGAHIEEMWVAALDSSHRPINLFKVASGSEMACVIYPREIMKAVLLSNAPCFAMAHNHPSGETKPSQPDREFTRAIQAAAKTLELRMLDHLIITDKSFFSFKKEGLL